MPRFRDIPQFTRDSNYHVDIAWEYMFSDDGWLVGMIESAGLDIDPPFQRAHVWLEHQQIRYCEFILRGGKSSKELYFNAPNWPQCSDKSTMVLVDGKQRLEAARRFIQNEIPVFGYYKNEYTDRLDMLRARFSVNINNLETDAEVLQWYLDLNDGGVVHTKDELEKVRKMLIKIENGV
jgi:hypothetical protein